MKILHGKNTMKKSKAIISLAVFGCAMCIVLSGFQSFGAKVSPIEITADFAENTTLDRGNIYYVPDTYPTIQAAISNVHVINGDTIIVRESQIPYTGDGFRDIDFKGKAITVQSENGPETCTIDCQGSEEDPHRGFIFQSGERLNSILKGFTIKNGFVNVGSDYIIDPGAAGDGFNIGGGGAILCKGASPTIINNVFVNNVAFVRGGYNPKEANAAGGAILCATNIIPNGGGYDFKHSYPTIEGNILESNKVIAYYYYGVAGDGKAVGGAITCWRCSGWWNSEVDTTQIKNNVIKECIAITNGYYQNCIAHQCGKGGGIACLRTSPLIQGNSIDGNIAGGSGENDFDLSSGAQQSILFSDLDSDNEDFLASALTVDCEGGGIYLHPCLSTSSNPIIDNNDIINNKALKYNEETIAWYASFTSAGGGVYSSSNSPMFTNNPHVENNQAIVILHYPGGGGIVKTNLVARGGGFFGFAKEFKNNKISNNDAKVTRSGATPLPIISVRASAGGGGVFGDGYDMVIENNVIIDNRATVQEVENVEETEAYGGGIVLGEGEIVNNRIQNNKAIGSSQVNGEKVAFGGGIDATGACFINRNIIITNSASVDQPTVNDFSLFKFMKIPDCHNPVELENIPVCGGGIAVTGPHVYITNNIIAGNIARANHQTGGLFKVLGGGIALTEDAGTTENLDIVGNTIVDNKAITNLLGESYGGGVGFATPDENYILNSIIWNNQAERGSEIAVVGGIGGVHVTYSDIKGGESGTYYTKGDNLYCYITWSGAIANLGPCNYNGKIYPTVDYPGEGNMGDDLEKHNPQFVLPGKWDGEEYIPGNYRLLWSAKHQNQLKRSPCIDVGSNANPAHWPSGNPCLYETCINFLFEKDIDDQCRFLDGPAVTGSLNRCDKYGSFAVIDMGADEYGAPNIVGDMNCDGKVDFDDINPFVLALSNWEEWKNRYLYCPNCDCAEQNADINGDGVYGGLNGFGDINPFVSLLGSLYGG